MNISPARTAAFDILFRIETEKAFSSVLLPQYENKLSAKDKSLCHEIVLGVLRRRIYIDKLIECFTAKPLADSAVQLSLRIGIFQLLFLDKIPAYSAINDSVNLVKRAKKMSAKGLVNAILHRIQRERPDFKYVDEVEQISVETSHPLWLVEKWVVEFGLQEAEALARANNSPPLIAFRLTEKGKKKGLEPRTCWTSGKFVDGCFFAAGVDPDLLKLAEAGEIYFQDEASQLVGAAIDLDPGAVFLDVCAAPGGKTTLIASRFSRPAKLLAAGDLHWHRVKFLKDNCELQSVSVSVMQYNAETALPFANETFDNVLIDAPCSGTGTIRHNPEIRYSLTPRDFNELSAKQLRILENASKLMKPGGRLFYSTCSLEVEENEGVIDQFLKRADHFRKISGNLPKRFMTLDGFVRTLPHRDNMDGFFLAVLERIEKPA